MAAAVENGSEIEISDAEIDEIIDEIIEEAGGDPRQAIRCLVHDVAKLALDAETRFFRAGAFAALQGSRWAMTWSISIFDPVTPPNCSTGHGCLSGFAATIARSAATPSWRRAPHAMASSSRSANCSRYSGGPARTRPRYGSAGSGSTASNARARRRSGRSASAGLAPGHGGLDGDTGRQEAGVMKPISSRKRRT